MNGFLVKLFSKKVKGIIIVRDFIIFLGELGILLMSILFIVTAGAAMGEFVFNFDARLASETLFGFHAAAAMTGNNFAASFVMPPNPYRIKIDKDGENYFMFIDSTREIFNLANTAVVKIQPPRKLFLVHSTDNEINVLDAKMDEKHNWKAGVEKTGAEITTLVEQQVK
ncbi:MAG: hypothetical protein HYS53_02520 [Candidatus Aenigmarchaeota archaeon]|nr:hypothetical protein [Candidatus Aenigmarchaeota archaeon]